MEFYGSQAETYAVYLSNAIDAFILTLEHNQPPKVFVAYSKFVILNAHKLLCIGDTVHRNVVNAKLKASVLERSNQLCQVCAFLPTGSFSSGWGETLNLTFLFLSLSRLAGIADVRSEHQKGWQGVPKCRCRSRNDRLCPGRFQIGAKPKNLFSSTDHFNKWSKVNENAQIKKKLVEMLERASTQTLDWTTHTHTHTQNNATYHDF
jgi:hypothetical protein